MTDTDYDDDELDDEVIPSQVTYKLFCRPTMIPGLHLVTSTARIIDTHLFYLSHHFQLEPALQKSYCSKVSQVTQVSASVYKLFPKSMYGFDHHNVM